MSLENVLALGARVRFATETLPAQNVAGEPGGEAVRQGIERFVTTLFVISIETDALASVPRDEVADPPPPNIPLIGGGGAGIGDGDGVLGPEPPQAAPIAPMRPSNHRRVMDRPRMIRGQTLQPATYQAVTAPHPATIRAGGDNIRPKYLIGCAISHGAAPQFRSVSTVQSIEL